MIDNDNSGWLGLNVTSRQKIVELNLVVGVRNEPIEAFISELMGAPIFGKFSPTIAVHIGYLMPARTYTPWFFDDEPWDDQIQAITGSVREFAVPFMDKNASLEALSRQLREYTFWDRLIYRLPACYFLLDDRRLAASLNAEYREQIGDRRDAAAEQYRVFSAAMQALIGSERAFR